MIKNWFKLYEQADIRRWVSCRGTDLTKLSLNAHPNIYISDEMPLHMHIEKQGYTTGTKFHDYPGD
jgi:hypothetical protein